MKVAVYDIILDGEVIYVGITTNPRSREYNHKNSRRIPGRAYMVVVDWFKTKKAALACEKARITALRPRLNKAHAECHEHDVQELARQLCEQDDEMAAKARKERYRAAFEKLHEEWEQWEKENGGPLQGPRDLRPLQQIRDWEAGKRPCQIAGKR